MKIKNVLKATGGKLVKGNVNAAVNGFSIDSRTLKKGEFFIAIKGKRLNGHNFIKEAVKKGAAGAIVSQNLVHSSQSTVHNRWTMDHRLWTLIQVKNTAKALGDLAHYKRMQSRATVIAVTGSNGKTTTKDMIASIIKKSFKVLSSRGTENNEIGLPLTLLRLKNEKFCILEIGMNHLGEIDYLSKIARPEVGVITNIGPCHLAGLGSIEEVFKAKTELLKYMDKEKTLIINGDDPYLSKIKRKTLRIIKFGLKECNDIKATSIMPKWRGYNFYVNGKYNIQLNLLGRHNIYNALAAIAVAQTLGLGKKAIQSALKNFKAPYGRLKLKEVNGVCLIDDSYNSNPVSLKSAVDFLADYRTSGRKILVSGDMLELGSMSKYYHKSIAHMVKARGIDMLITVGKHSYNTYLTAKRNGMKKGSLWHFDKAEKAGRYLKEIVSKGDLILVKGSRGMMMEDAIKCFTTSSTR